MKALLRTAIDDVIERLHQAGILADSARPDYQIETPKLEAHGDFSTNVAMLLAKANRRAPRDLANELAQALAALPLFSRVEVAGPGFINFVLADDVVFDVVREVHDAGETYGRNDSGAGRRVQVEFVSANPTGPLHIGHGRGAAVGSVLARLLAASGYAVEREYYVNDAGRQMDILALSVWLRYLQSYQLEVPFPAQAYRGGYIEDIARALRARDGDAFKRAADNVPPAIASSDDERHLDDAIAAARAALGADAFDAVRDFAKDVILAEIADDLRAFGVDFDCWYSEASLNRNGAIDTAIAELVEAGFIYTEAGAQWFRSTDFGDEKDRVVVRDNGVKTYFASDIAYHREKFVRGFERVVNIWGADHHGYIPRVRAALKALNLDAAKLDVVLVQFAALVRGGEKVSMSTRAGEFVTLKHLVDEVGVDAARYFYVMRRSDQHLEFDLDLATSQSNDNPVYYVQYAHARVCSVFRQAGERATLAPPAGARLAEFLREPPERRLAIVLSKFSEVVASAAAAAEPHQLTNYLRDLATEFHAYYNGHKVLVDDAGVCWARLRLIGAVRQVIANALGLLAISAPSEM
ncbi:MAG: arginine--tRNA ligase [Proteobacteria bacterium]|nr:arginine--tRNA ligase [Pseudomonadota bacterium]